MRINSDGYRIYGIQREAVGKNSDGKLVFDKRISEEAERLLPMSTAAKVLQEMRALDYDIGKVSEPLRSNVVKSVMKLKDLLEQKRVQSMRALLVVALSFDSAFYLMPFLKEYLRLSVSDELKQKGVASCEISFVLSLQDSRVSA